MTSFFADFKEKFLASFGSKWQNATALLESGVLSDSTQDAGPDERRAAPRVPTQLSAECRLVAGPAQWTTAATQDISEVGVRLMCSEPVHVGALVDLNILFPGAKKKTRIKGFVVWVRPNMDMSPENPFPFTVGIAFQNIRTYKGRNRLFSMMADLLCKQSLEEKSYDSAAPVKTREEIEEACTVLYNEYVKRGYCNEDRALGMHYNHFITLPDSQMFVLKKHGHIAGTISVIPDTPAFGLPMEGTFHKEIHGLRRLGVRMGEVGLLALNGEMFSRKKFSMADFSKYKALFSLFRAILHYAYYSDVHVTDLVIAIHPRHIELYNYILFKQIGKERLYSDGKAAIPMKMNISELLEYIKKGPMGVYMSQLVNLDAGRAENPYNEPRYKWDTESVRSFLMHRKRLWDQLPEPGRQFLIAQYPGL